MNGQFYTFEGLKYIGNNAAPQPAPVAFQGSAALGSATISAVTNLSELEDGQVVTSSLFPAGTYIIDVNAGSGTITLSQPATGSTPSGQLSNFTAGNLYTQNLPLTVHLLQGLIPQGSNVTFSQLTEANYDGYSPQVAEGPIIVNTPPPRQFAAWQFQRQTYQPVDYAVQNSIIGHCFTFTPPGSSEPVVVCTETYADALPLMQDGDIITFNPTMSFGFDQTAGIASPGIG